MEMLKSSNWMPWQRPMLVVLQQLGLDKYSAKVAKERQRTEEIEAQKKWSERDVRDAPESI